MGYLWDSSNISRIGIVLHATSGWSAATSPLRVLLTIALDFVVRPPESSSAIKHIQFSHILYVNSSNTQAHSKFDLSWCPFKPVFLNKINRIQCSKHKTIFECMWKLSHQNRAHRKVIQPAPIKATRLALLCKQMHNSKQPNAQLVMRSKNSVSTCQLKYHSGASLLKRLL